MTKIQRASESSGCFNATSIVVLAGGRGTRLWPGSTPTLPKQLRSFGAGRTLLQQTIDRLLPRFDPDRIFVVTERPIELESRMQLPQLPATNFIVEPQGRNTGPALALAAAVLNAREPGGTALSMPADQAIHADLPFYASLESAVRIASDPVLAMLGISPKSGAVGLGYLRTGQTVATNEPLVVQELIGLIEKPERSLAGQLAASGSYLWNTGIMAWRPEVLVDFFRACQPDMMTEMENVARTLRTDDFQRRLGDLYKRLEGYPIETAMLKHLPRARVLNVDISWSDVGTWDGIFDLMSLDGDDNRISGKAFAVNSRRVSIYNEKGPIIAVAGIDDIFVVAMNGRVLITRRDQAHLLRHISDIDEM